jgi:nucleoside-diphosphate-sugar epimerase
MGMRIFIIGATGYLGSAIGRRLVRAGHDVHGLTRAEANRAVLESRGITPVVGDVTDPESFLGPLKNCDAVVHAVEDPNDIAGTDQKALEAVRTAVADGRVKRLLYTSGTWVHGDTGGKVIDETTPLDPLPVVSWRAAHEAMALDTGDSGLETVILRAPIVYGGSRGILGRLWKEAREKRTVTCYGDGSQHWATVHVDDVAEAYRLAIEHAKPGECFVLSDDSNLTMRELAESIAGATGAAVKEWPREQVIEKLGSYGEALLTDLRVNAAKARRELGWVPRHTSFAREAEALYGEWQAELKQAVN